MVTTGNTILITGGGSGIGRALAEAFHQLGNHVIIAGRRQAVLDAVVAANPGMSGLALDIEDPKAISEFAAKITTEFPALNVVLNNAGIMRPENILEGGLSDAEAMITTNLLGPIRLTAALLPHLLKQPTSTIINTSSGLAFVPMAITPTYCGTKAAIHSYTQSLRFQLKGTSVAVLELIPPYVGTELLPGAASDPRAMPLDKFIAEVMQIFTTQPDAEEICVETVNPLRFAVEGGHYKETFEGLNASTAH